jgi:hypothetical protein
VSTKNTRTTAPAFTDAEQELIRAAASAVFSDCAYDILQAIADDSGKSIERVTISRDEAIETALDADRTSAKLKQWRRQWAAKGDARALDVSDDLLARFEAASYDALIALVRPAFGMRRYGL